MAAANAQSFTPLRGNLIDIHPNARWEQDGVLVAGGNNNGKELNQLCDPWGLYVDDDQTVYVADHHNHRIVGWKNGATSGKVVAGGNEPGSGDHQLYDPRDVIVDKETDSLIICDRRNRRVVRWPCRDGTRGETIISGIDCPSLTMDENGSLYVTDVKNHVVKRYRGGDSQWTVVAGGQGQGNRDNQLDCPQYVFVDRSHTVYVSELGAHRVTKWVKDATRGTIIAGGQRAGNGPTELSGPEGIVVDQLGTVYVADQNNHRIMRWPEGAIQGSVIVGGHGPGDQPNQLDRPFGLSFDRYGNLYVVNFGNNLVKKFNIIPNE